MVTWLQQRVSMRSSLEQNGAGPRADLIRAIESLHDKTTDLVAAKSQFAESHAEIGVLTRGINRTRQTFVADNQQKLAEAERQVDDLTEHLSKAEARQKERVLKSPIEGTVSALSVTTPGQVVGAGEELMRITATALMALAPATETFAMRCIRGRTDDSIRHRAYSTKTTCVQGGIHKWKAVSLLPRGGR